GVAGLAAAEALTRAGVPFTLFEGASRGGGRIRTGQGLFGTGLSTELGAEFIDSSHVRIRKLAQELGLPLLDTWQTTKLRTETYVFKGQRYDDLAVARAIQPYLPRFARDKASLGKIHYQHPGAWTAFDRISISDYLDQLGMSGWIRSFIESAYLAEFGLEVGEQSALNLVDLIGTKLVDGEFSIIGDSDERYKIRGGNQRLVDALAARHQAMTKLGHRLEALAPSGSGYRLTFAQADGPSVEVEAPFVILALPFSTLRDVAISVPLPQAKQRAIKEIGYGTNAKLILGFKRRVWQDTGFQGGFVSDGILPNGWDSSLYQGGDAGSLTLFMGGKLGPELGQGTPLAQATRRMAGLEQIFAGAGAAFTGKVERADWPGNPWARGSYACYKVGQCQAFRGAESEPVGGLYFAGEHCAGENQGFMEGAIESAQVAAAAVAKALSPLRSRGA
ncbi:MAG: FAD-binding protein, partial [Cyanobacteria bacterium RYN_339]|nr:FAD-binding protein [Cyanobacteria bacterium RYN_339]